MDARLALGEHASLVGELDELVRRHPHRERLRAAHMRALCRAGRQADALASYEQLRVRLIEDLGLTPGPEIARLQRAVLVQDPELEVAVPNTGRARTNLPVPRSRLIGRDPAVAEVIERLRSGRLVTLTGPGGLGKTASPWPPPSAWPARRGRSRRGREPAVDGVWVVELAGWEAPDGDDGSDRVAEHVAAVLGIPDLAAVRPGPPVGSAGGTARLGRTLADRHVLLVLDNCEHLVGPVSALARALLEAAPGLRILATGREPLGVPGELVWPVPPLDVPEGDGAEGLARSSAVRLLVERAAAGAPGSRSTATTRPPSPPSAGGWTACWRSSWPPPGSGGSASMRWPSGSTTGSRSWRPARGGCRPATARCAPSSTGAGTCSARPSRPSCAGCPSTPLGRTS